ncbi:hypothetical protein BGZ88_008597 [Linnemannia elongata]|nr:hypothetical protein BGZ88_008597 [Linnemannia elongata]
MANDLFYLIKQDRENLANLTRGITQANPDNRTRRANDAINLVAMMIHGENAVIYPPLQESSPEGATMVEDSLKRLRSIVVDLDRLERMEFNDLSYPSFFDRTFDRFFQHWEVEDRSVRMLEDLMNSSDFVLLGPRWTTARSTAPSRPLAALQAVESSAAKVTQQQQEPKHQVSTAGQAQQGCQQGAQRSMIFSQHLHQILDNAHDVLTRMKQQQGQKKDQGGSAAGSEAKSHQKDCGCMGPCTCPPKTKSATASARLERQPSTV